MSTGALAILLHMTPNRFPGLTTIGKVVFVLDLVLFVVFFIMIVGRFILVSSSFYQSLHNTYRSSLFRRVLGINCSDLAEH